MTVHTIGQFAAPVAINRLLMWAPLLFLMPSMAHDICVSFLESGRTEETVVRPWFWILYLFLVPILGSMGFQYYMTTMTHVVVRTESILTQLVFNHSLRVRVEYEGSEKNSEDNQKKDMSSFLGKVNNLVTSDMATIRQANHFVMLCECQWFRPLDGHNVFVNDPLVQSGISPFKLQPPVRFSISFSDGGQSTSLPVVTRRTDQVLVLLSDWHC